MWCIQEDSLCEKISMIFKRLFDIVASLFGLLLIWWIFPLVAFLIHKKMPGGSAFFVQKRVGKGRKLFKCHKFRSMVVSHNGSSVSVEGDSRITPFGAKLRHYKIDELPELWDVLIGNMSFVGPRPDVPGYADKLEGYDRDVLKLRPGITGPATLKYRLEDEMISEYVAKKQAEGDARPMQEIATEYNDKVIYPDKVRLNCYYYRHYSFWKDIEMIFATVLGRKVIDKYAPGVQEEPDRVLENDMDCLAEFSKQNDNVDFAGRIVWKPLVGADGSPCSTPTVRSRKWRCSISVSTRDVPLPMCCAPTSATTAG